MAMAVISLFILFFSFSISSKSFPYPKLQKYLYQRCVWCFAFWIYNRVSHVKKVKIIISFWNFWLVKQEVKFQGKWEWTMGDWGRTFHRRESRCVWYSRCWKRSAWKSTTQTRKFWKRFGTREFRCRSCSRTSLWWTPPPTRHSPTNGFDPTSYRFTQKRSSATSSSATNSSAAQVRLFGINFLPLLCTFCYFKLSPYNFSIIGLKVFNAQIIIISHNAW